MLMKCIFGAANDHLNAFVANPTQEQMHFGMLTKCIFGARNDHKNAFAYQFQLATNAFQVQFEYSQNTSLVYLDAEKMLTNHDIKLKFFPTTP